MMILDFVAQLNLFYKFYRNNQPTSTNGFNATELPVVMIVAIAAIHSSRNGALQALLHHHDAYTLKHVQLTTLYPIMVDS